MKPEELLQNLREAGMDDEAIKELLSETIAALEPQPQPEEEKQEASKLLGVEL